MGSIESMEYFNGRNIDVYSTIRSLLNNNSQYNLMLEKAIEFFSNESNFIKSDGKIDEEAPLIPAIVIWPLCNDVANKDFYKLVMEALNRLDPVLYKSLSNPLEHGMERVNLTEEEKKFFDDYFRGTILAIYISYLHNESNQEIINLIGKSSLFKSIDPSLFIKEYLYLFHKYKLPFPKHLVNFYDKNFIISTWKEVLSSFEKYTAEGIGIILTKNFPLSFLNAEDRIDTLKDHWQEMSESCRNAFLSANIVNCTTNYLEDNENEENWAGIFCKLYDLITLIDNDSSKFQLKKVISKAICAKGDFKTMFTLIGIDDTFLQFFENSNLSVPTEHYKNDDGNFDDDRICADYRRKLINFSYLESIYTAEQILELIEDEKLPIDMYISLSEDEKKNKKRVSNEYVSKRYTVSDDRKWDDAKVCEYYRLGILDNDNIQGIYTAEQIFDCIDREMLPRDFYDRGEQSMAQHVSNEHIQERYNASDSMDDDKVCGYYQRGILDNDNLNSIYGIVQIFDFIERGKLPADYFEHQGGLDVEQWTEIYTEPETNDSRVISLYNKGVIKLEHIEETCDGADEFLTLVASGLNVDFNNRGEKLRIPITRSDVADSFEGDIDYAIQLLKLYSNPEMDATDLRQVFDSYETISDRSLKLGEAIAENGRSQIDLDRLVESSVLSHSDLLMLRDNGIISSEEYERYVISMLENEENAKSLAEANRNTSNGNSERTIELIEEDELKDVKVRTYESAGIAAFITDDGLFLLTLPELYRYSEKQEDGNYTFYRSEDLLSQSKAVKRINTTGTKANIISSMRKAAANLCTRTGMDVIMAKYGESYDDVLRNMRNRWETVESEFKNYIGEEVDVEGQ